MSFLSKLKEVLSTRTTGATRTPIPSSLSWRVVLSEIGASRPTCPYCARAFDRMPQRKRSCPECGGVLYSRKRAVDGTKVLLTEAQALEGEAQDALVTLAAEGAGNAELDGLVGSLHVTLDRMPTADEVVCQYLTRSAAKHAELCNWGLYRNARFNLAESYARRRSYEEALRLFLEVSLIDLNGPRNRGTKDPAALRRIPPFEPHAGSLASGVLSRTIDVITELKFSRDELQRLFESVASAMTTVTNLPRPTSAAWQELSAALADGWS